VVAGAGASGVGQRSRDPSVKTLSVLITAYLSSRRKRGNLSMLGTLLVLLVAMVVFYSVTFHWLMAREGQQHSWLTGFYWTMVSMSTLGFGDITFKSDLGRMFSVLVLTTGTIYLLVLLPFTFIQFFYAPWLEARDATRAPRELPAETSGHVLLTSYGPIDVALIARLSQFGTAYCVIVPEVADALMLYDKGVRVMVGEHDDPATYRRARADRAAMVVALVSDTANTNIAMTARESAPTVPIVARANHPASVDVLELAGCDLVLQLDDLLGRTMARRVFARTGRSHFVGEVDGLRIAEAAAVGTSLVGHTLRDLRLRERFNVTVGGVWERGRYTLGGPDTVVTTDTVLLLAGTQSQLDAYDREFGRETWAPAFAVIIGGGRVGRAVARALREQGIDYRIVEKLSARVAEGDEHAVVGDAADLEVLKQAGIDHASVVIVTTHEDDMNIYLTLYCRRLRPDLLVLSRATLERNTLTLHRAGADFVLSYSAMGANAIVNRLRDSSLLLLAEGLDVATVRVPAALVGRTLQESGIRSETGVNVLAIRHRGVMTINPDANTPIPDGAELVMLGDRESERRFFEKYS
jgi:voltage-gated potassium channel